MNATKLKYKDALLECGHCKSLFVGSPGQAYNHIKERKNVFCSEICRFAYLRGKFSTPVPEHTCTQCGVIFASRRAAKFCGMKCYTGSKQFSDMLADSREKAMTPWSIARRAERARRGEGKPCLECGANVYAKKSDRARKFCNVLCYRAYMAKRFDRQIANPEELSLPQGYDDFLSKEQLPCIVAGCDWVGDHLSLHVNQMHGITAADFKRAAGFNQSSGIVSRPLARVLREREVQGLAADEEMRRLGSFAIGASHILAYSSLEGKEHRAKARAMNTGTGPNRLCAGCGKVFTQPCPMGRKLYCTKECRNAKYLRDQKTKHAKRKKASASDPPASSSTD